MSTVAHELRSPLTSVKGFTATLLAKWHRFNDDQKRVMLETVNADADRVTRLITELLDVSRIEAGRLEMRRQVVDLAEEVRKVIAGRVAAGEPAERFRFETRGELPEMWLDPDKMGQILGNLVENAVRHGAGTVTIVVEPDAHKEGAGSVGARRGRGHPARGRPARLPAVLARHRRQPPRRHRPRPLHRQGPGRGARRHDHRAAGARRRRRVPIYLPAGAPDYAT